MNKGFMVVFDGSNGAGKTTVINEVEKYIAQKGLDVVLTREAWWYKHWGKNQKYYS